MQPFTQAALDAVDAYLNRNEATRAMERLVDLISQLPVDDLVLARPDIEKIIGRFYQKKQRDLRLLLDRRLALRDAGRGNLDAGRQESSSSRRTATKPGRPISDERSVDSVRAEYARQLAELRDHHIFQWNGAYRETVGYLFKDLRSFGEVSGSASPYLAVAATALAAHTADIFQRGFNYITGTLAASPDIAVAKSIGGLQRFLFLVIDFYSSSVVKVGSKEEATHLRNVTSTMLFGVLSGYSRVQFGGKTGWNLLQVYPLQWAHSLPFVSSSDLHLLIECAPATDFTANLAEIVKPIAAAIDRAMQWLPHDQHCLPRIGRYGQFPPRLEVTLTSPTLAGAQEKVVAFVAPPISHSGPLDDAISGGALLTLARVAPVLWQENEARWQGRVLEATRVGTIQDHELDLAERAFAILEKAFTPALRDSAEVLTFSRNVARDFPLRDPIVRRFYLVPRHSVQSLLDTFSHGTGAHVWCSVRRSGKTTATVDLAGDTERSVVVMQTMDHQPDKPDLNLFSTRVVAALEQGKSLSPQFFEEAVMECSLASSPVRLQQARKVFIIDEYETLFGLMAAVSKRDDWVRYAVVQPLLSQMVAFSTSNLLVFLGQRPDAHFILMSQNQLSPLVQQDSFPLFEHHESGTKTEFARFVGNVLTEQVPFAPAFVDAVFQETSGHPYLTVNVLVDFCDWLIANKRPAANLLLSADDFDAFSKERLTAAVLQRSPHYSTFQQMVADSLSESTREREPWLFAVTTILHRLGRQHPRALACSEPQYKELAADVAPLAGSSPGQLLLSARMANFLVMQGGQVKPAIRIFGRLAAVASAEVN